MDLPSGTTSEGTIDIGKFFPVWGGGSSSNERDSDGYQPSCL